MPFHEKNVIETFKLYQEIRDAMSPSAKDRYVVVDLRSPLDRDRAHDGVQGALKVPWDDANESVDIRYFPCEVEVQIVLFCNDGRIAAKAKEFLEAAGHLNVLNAYSVKHIHTALNGDGA